MPFIITDPCIETKDAACVDVCPVDCIHPRKDEPEFAAMTMLYIHPEECIDCGACVPACPVAAIYESIDATPASQKDLIEPNAIYRNGDINKIYAKWFLNPIPPNGISLNVPMSAVLKRVIEKPTDNGDPEAYAIRNAAQ